VNGYRIILSTLYLLLAVLMPYLHMPLHAHEHEAVQQETTCAAHHNHHHADEKEAPEHHDGSDCRLCELTLLPADIPGVAYAPSYSGALHSAVLTETTFFFTQLHFPHEARGPPFMTV
jgi:hypothetical protein